MNDRLRLNRAGRDDSSGAGRGADPQLTAANYGDWALRCRRTPTNTKFCEIVTSISTTNGQQEIPVAELAFGRLGKTDRRAKVGGRRRAGHGSPFGRHRNRRRFRAFPG
jgi:hypothetical protein